MGVKVCWFKKHTVVSSNTVEQGERKQRTHHPPVPNAKVHGSNLSVLLYLKETFLQLPFVMHLLPSSTVPFLHH